MGGMGGIEGIGEKSSGENHQRQSVYCIERIRLVAPRSDAEFGSTIRHHRSSCSPPLGKLRPNPVHLEIDKGDDEEGFREANWLRGVPLNPIAEAWKQYPNRLVSVSVFVTSLHACAVLHIENMPCNRGRCTLYSVLCTKVLYYVDG